jgi:peptidyl-dipeptidase A
MLGQAVFLAGLRGLTGRVLLIAGNIMGGQAASVQAAEQPPPATTKNAENHAMTVEAQTFLTRYEREFSRLEIQANLTSWKAANSGSADDFAESAAAALALRKLHSDRDAYRQVQQLLQAAEQLTPVQRRSLRLAALEYQRNQLSAESLEQMVQLSKRIERTFSTFRGELDGQSLSNNQLLEQLRNERDSARRQRLWEALKSVGGAVAPQLVELARLRNAAARSLGFQNFWDMEIRLQEHDPQQILPLFDELERLTRAPFGQIKSQIDRERAARFGLASEALWPWHYDNPFFQDAPPSEQVDLNEFYQGKSQEQIVEIARAFYNGIGLSADDVLRRSDLYERAGKDQHAFCTSIDRSGDVRTLCNIKPTEEWMDTTLHELGHAVYDLGVARDLPYVQRMPAHAFTTEGVAMLFGSLAKHPTWLVPCAGANPQRVQELATAILEQRRREQLVFARWTLVMLHFEKALYEDPDQDLNARWWEFVTRFQQLRQPPARQAPDWASKPHFTIAPVYYHNYMLGELFAAQLRHVLAKQTGHAGKTAELRFDGRREIGDFLRQRVFRPGAAQPWPEFVRTATDEPLSPRYFAAEVGGS